MEISGKKVIDAKKPLELEITTSDVRLGNTKDPGGCAAALALKRQTGVKAARVHVGRVYIETPDAWVRYITPASLRAEIIAFDRGGSFEAGEYHLSPCPPTAKLGAHYGGDYNHKQKKSKKPKIARIKHHITTGVRHTLVK